MGVPPECTLSESYVNVWLLLDTVNFSPNSQRILVPSALVSAEHCDELDCISNEG